MLIVTAAQMQAIDRRTIEEFGLPGRLLMENAGRGAARCFLERIYIKGPAPVGILAGRGNNGGDGFVVARYLSQRGVDATVFLLCEKQQVQGDAAANLALLGPLGVPVIELPELARFSAQQERMRRMAYWIDALLGTGLKEDVKGYFKEALDFIDEQKRPTLAVDLPSGLNADTGRPCGVCLKADLTVTFGLPKIGQLVEPGAAYCGELVIIDIGIPPTVLQDLTPAVRLIDGPHVRRLLPQRAGDTHKGRTGHALIIAGSKGKTGAAALATMATLRTGAGLATLAAPDGLNAILESLVIEAMTLPLPDRGDEVRMPEAYELIRRAAENSQCVALGPGLGLSAAVGQLVAEVVTGIDLPMVIDADGLNHLAGRLGLLDQRQAPTVLTPHPGEMARLSGWPIARIQSDRVKAAQALAVDHRVYVVLKGARTVVAEPEGAVWINSSGNSGMACGGMGDVLTGAIAGLIAQACPAGEAVRAAVYLHGLAADLLCGARPWGYLATEVMDALPQAIARVLTDPPASIIQGPLL